LIYIHPEATDTTDFYLQVVCLDYNSISILDYNSIFISKSPCMKQLLNLFFFFANEQLFNSNLMD
jgi:hypothetical protein